MKWANSLGKITLIDLLDTQLSQAFILLKKKKKFKKHSICEVQ